MAKRKDTPDLMSDMLGQPATPEPEPPETPPAPEPTPLRQPQPQSSRNRRMTSDALYSYVDGEKTQATLYLADDTHEDMEEAVTQLRRYVVKTLPDGKKKRALVTRSMLAEFALQEFISDLEENGIESFWSRLVSRL